MASRKPPIFTAEELLDVADALAVQAERMAALAADPATKPNLARVYQAKVATLKALRTRALSA